MSELHRMPVAGAAPPRKVYILEESPSHSRVTTASGRAWADPGQKIPERDPKIRELDPKIQAGALKKHRWAPRWALAAVAALLVLSCLLWLVLHGVALKNQQELREELELLWENSSGNWAQAQQELHQAQQQQVELRRIIELLCQTINDSQKCPQGWQFYKSSCYFFSEMERSWDSARTACAAFEAHLVVVSTEEEQMFLMKNIQGNNTYWMGVTDQQHEGKWTWVTGKSPSFGFWDVWEEDPDKEHKDCGLMKPNGRWTNERCSKGSRWICEKSWDCNFSPLFPIAEEPAPDL